MPGRLWVAAPALCCLAAAPTPPPDATAAAAQLRAAEQARAAGLAAQLRALSTAQAAQAQADRLAEARVVSAARLRDAEEATEQAARRMADLAGQRREAELRSAQQAENLGPLLPLIERLALFPVETLLAIPADPEQTLRGVAVLQGITHDMARQAERLQRRRAEVARLTASMQVQAPVLEAAQQAQARQAAALDTQIDQARANVSAAERAGIEAARQAQDAASRAVSLRDVIAQLDAQRQRAQAQARADAAADARARHGQAGRAARARVAAVSLVAGPGLAAPQGQLTAPVAGRVIRAWGAPTDAGPATGISFQPAPAARVTAPCGGRVLFAAPFRSYGQLLIIDCGGGYDFVLAGFQRLDAQLGRMLRAGEPVGTMPNWDPRGTGSRPALYMELRHGGVAIDPAPFLRGRP